MEYIISKNEITRRKKAYITFSVCLISSLLIGSSIYKLYDFILIDLFVAIGLLLLGIQSFIFFRYLSNTKIQLNTTQLQKITHVKTEIYPLTKINQITIKWTSQRNIREIYIWLSNGESVFITAIENFIFLKDQLLKNTHKDTVIHEQFEKINYDHPLFYPTLGLLIGSISTFSLRSLLFLNSNHIQVMSYLIIIYSIGLGIYFVNATPISKRSGKTTKSLDYLIGIPFICLSLLCCWFMYIN